MMKLIRIYMSHAIRGARGKDATAEDMQANNNAAMKAARVIRAYLYPLPVELYCPGEHDEFVMIAYHKGVLSEEQILDTDCEIVKRCDILVWYSALGPSSGAEVERDAARLCGTCIVEIPALDVCYLERLAIFVRELCQTNC